MITENDIIFDHLYDDFKRTMDGDGNVNLIAYMEENEISQELMMQIWEAYILEVKKRSDR
tara:strand:- start:645 stop:824 length:180 start_codon:yes stop_codon:yes gene_type:complete